MMHIGEEIMKKIYEFKGLSKNQKKELTKNYFKSEWKNLLISYIFIILSSSKPLFSSKNGALFVLIWFSYSIVYICLYKPKRLYE